MGLGKVKVKLGWEWGKNRKNIKETHYNIFYLANKLHKKF